LTRLCPVRPRRPYLPWPCESGAPRRGDKLDSRAPGLPRG
jgi:hypothetical protein